MALQINTNVQTADGFDVQPFAFLEIFLLNKDAWINIFYFKSYQDQIQGKSPLQIPSLPNQVQLTENLTGAIFWGNELALWIHNQAKNEIENITGANSVVIVTSDNVAI